MQQQDKNERHLNSDTLLYLIYLMYKCNLVTRRHVKDMLKVIREQKLPENLAKYLTEEGERSA